MRRRLRPALVALEDRTAPAVFTVLTLNDAGANSLRDCVAKANAAFGPDTVNFDMALSGTVTLTTGEIAVNDATSFVGPGSSVIAISGNNASRIFNLIAARPGPPLRLSGLTLTAGKVGTGVNGGAIVGDNEALSLSQCVLTGNSAGGSGGVLYASGGLSLSADGCTFASNSAFNAGGVLVNINSSKTVLNACAISGNTAGRTGGIYVTSYLLVSGSTIANNKSTNTSIGGGGGIRAVGTFPAGGLTIRNSTISGNSAASQGGGGVMLNSFSGTLVVQNSTITNNSVTGPGGGVARLSGTGTVQLDSTIIAQNTSTAGTPDLSFNAATAVTANNSIIGVADKGSFTLSGTGNQSGTLALPFNANLGKLGDYGGPMQTHRLLVGSPGAGQGLESGRAHDRPARLRAGVRRRAGCGCGGD